MDGLAALGVGVVCGVARAHGDVLVIGAGGSVNFGVGRDRSARRGAAWEDRRGGRLQLRHDVWVERSHADCSRLQVSVRLYFCGLKLGKRMIRAFCDARHFIAWWCCERDNASQA